MAALLDMMQVQDVLVVVSRWYGGILLGPDRFKHIATVTRAILVANGFQSSAADSTSIKKKKKKK